VRKIALLYTKKSMQEKFSFEEMNLFPLSGKAVLKHNLAEEEVK
jgi:hemerythrin superfamily protein